MCGNKGLYCMFLFCCTSQALSVSHSVRWYSSQPPTGGGGFIKAFVDNLRKSLVKDQEMQKSLKAFESERKKVVQSDAVKLLREKSTLMKVCFLHE